MSRFYNSNRLLSHDSLFNAIVSSRGDGKTYDAKTKGINRFLKRKEQFLYIRRYDTETKKIKKFFDDVVMKYPDYEFKVDGGNFFMRHKNEKKWKPEHILGGYLILSKQMTVKSVPYPNVTWIIFDEFIISKKGVYRYLPDEVENFLELYSTISRDRDVKVLFLGNSITQVNPYFLYFDIRLVKGKRFVTKNDFTVEYYVPEEHIEHMENTRFGKMIKDTPYGRYAIRNEFVEDIDDYIKKRSKGCECRFCVLYKGTYIGFWYAYNKGVIYASKDYVKQTRFKYTLRMEDVRENHIMVRKPKENFHLAYVIEAFKNGFLCYEDIFIKDLCIQMLKGFVF